MISACPVLTQVLSAVALVAASPQVSALAHLASASTSAQPAAAAATVPPTRPRGLGVSSSAMSTERRLDDTATEACVMMAVYIQVRARIGARRAPGGRGKSAVVYSYSSTQL